MIATESFSPVIFDLPSAFIPVEGNLQSFATSAKKAAVVAAKIALVVGVVLSRIAVGVMGLYAVITYASSCQGILAALGLGAVSGAIGGISGASVALTAFLAEKHKMYRLTSHNARDCASFLVASAYGAVGAAALVLSLPYRVGKNLSNFADRMFSRMENVSIHFV
jgi:hypothetical protein